MRRGLVRSRAEARELIGAGRVTISGAPALKAASLVSAADALAVSGPPREYASRGGHKLAGALDTLGVDPAGRDCLDAGASTGGFTDVLLQRGATRVVAVDVGYGQLAWTLRNDPRVVVLDRTNVRSLEPGAFPGPPPNLVVADLSFISLVLVLPALQRTAAPGADHVLLVKPQFEAGRERVGKGGVVKDPRVWRQAMLQVAEAGAAAGLGLQGAVASSLPGPSGNREFFLHLRAGGEADPVAVIEAAVEALESPS